jgi:serine/threonine protein phosphatase PrpC
MAAPEPEDVLASCLRLDRGGPHYLAPEACLPGGAPSPVWSLAAYVYCHLAGFPDGLPGLGPEAFGFCFPPLRVYAPHLPPGIEPAVRRSLSFNPEDRHPSEEAFLEDLAGAIQASQARDAWNGRVSLQVTSATRIGLLHELSGIPNQDSMGVFPTGDGLAAFVCDGVTHALIGSGDLASQTAAACFAGSLPRLVGLARLEDRASGMLDAFEEAGRAILSRSLSLPLGRLARDPAYLMSTTALAAIVHGRGMLLACCGDSRAYLVRDGIAEQLTVDGDVRCVQLALGVPPEEAVSGADGQALYHCLGVARGLRAQALHDEERARPALTYLNLLPGDVVVLCTDGLVEEGVFLSPQDLAALVDANPGPALADLLAESARALHFGPDDSTEGSGDDVTCVVIQVT